MKEFKLKDLKRQMDKMTKEQLDQPIFFDSDNMCLSGVVLGFGRAKATLYYTGEDDPSPLLNMKQLKEAGYDAEDIESFSVEIRKGDYVIKF